MVREADQWDKTLKSDNSQRGYFHEGLPDWLPSLSSKLITKYMKYNLSQLYNQRNKIEDRIRKIEKEEEEKEKKELKKLFKTKFYLEVYNKVEEFDPISYILEDNKDDFREAIEDDGVLHITIGKIRICFIGNQELTAKEFKTEAMPIIEKFGFKWSDIN